MSDYISDQLRAEAARLRNSIAATPFSTAQALMQGAISSKARAEEKAARKTAAEQAQATALVEWGELCEVVGQATTVTGAVVRELLDLHKPYLGEYSYRAECEHCLEGSYDVERAEWPCESYAIIKGGLTP